MCVCVCVCVCPCTQDLERALSKRELIAVKGRATMARAKQSAPGGRLAKGTSAGLTQGQLGKAMGELERSVRETQKEVSRAHTHTHTHAETHTA